MGKQNLSPETMARRRAAGKVYYAERAAEIQAQRRARRDATPESKAERQARGRVYSAAYRAKQKPKVTPEEARRQHLLSTFRITLQQEQAMIAAQGGKCALCREPLGKRYAVDHDHDCCPRGKRPACGECIRGVLCMPCNTMEGWVSRAIRLGLIVAAGPMIEYRRGRAKPSPT